MSLLYIGLFLYHGNKIGKIKKNSVCHKSKLNYLAPPKQAASKARYVTGKVDGSQWYPIPTKSEGLVELWLTPECLLADECMRKICATHIAFILTQYLAKSGVATLSQLPYSPDLAPPDFFLSLRRNSFRDFGSLQRNYDEVLEGGFHDHEVDPPIDGLEQVTGHKS